MPTNSLIPTGTQWTLGDMVNGLIYEGVGPRKRKVQGVEATSLVSPDHNSPWGNTLPFLQGPVNTNSAVSRWSIWYIHLFIIFFAALGFCTNNGERWTLDWWPYAYDYRCVSTIPHSGPYAVGDICQLKALWTLILTSQYEWEKEKTFHNCTL